MDFLLNIGGIALALLIMAGAGVWVLNRDRRARGAQEAAELAFERTVGYGAAPSPSPLPSSLLSPLASPSPASSPSKAEQGAGGHDSYSGKGPLGETSPIAEERSASVSHETPIGISIGVGHGAGPSVGVNDASRRADRPLVDLIREKLTVAGAFDYDDGAIRSSDPALQGTFLRLKNGKRVAVIESGLAEDSPALHAMLRLVDAAVARGPGGHPLHIKRFEDFLGELLSL